MRLTLFASSSLSLSILLLMSPTLSGEVYLNDTNMSVSVGAGTSPGTFNNTFNSGATIEKVIDAPSASALEFHNQSTHIWFTANSVGGGLELIFDLGQEYDILELHFWNYTAENYDVDNIDFEFFDQAGVPVGSLSIQPALGSSPGIAAQDIPLPAPLNVQTVSAFLTGTNRQVDFQNIGFTANVSTPGTVPEPASWWLSAGLLSLMFPKRKRVSGHSS